MPFAETLHPFVALPTYPFVRDGMADGLFFRIIDEKKLKSLDLAQSPRTNHVEDDEQETFILGRPVDDAPEMESCKHCKKNVLKSGAKGHIAQCLKVKKEKALRKKEAREARERAREAAREEARKADGDAGGKGEDSDDDDDDKVKASKTKGAEPGKGGKKRKADTEAEKGPSKKKKKEEVKPKVAKPRGRFFSPPLFLAVLTLPFFFWNTRRTRIN